MKPMKPMKRLSIALSACALLSLGACSLRTETSEVETLEQICVESEAVVDGEATLNFDVGFAACMSSSCDSLQESSCEVELVDGTLVVTGVAVIESQLGGACTDDCQTPEAGCSITVPEGTYVVSGVEEDFEYTVGAAQDCGF